MTKRMHASSTVPSCKLLARSCWRSPGFLCSGLGCHLLAFLLNCACRDSADREHISHHTIPNNGAVKA